MLVAVMLVVIANAYVLQYMLILSSVIDLECIFSGDHKVYAVSDSLCFDMCIS